MNTTNTNSSMPECCHEGSCTSVQSTFYVKGICCTNEISTIHDIIDPIDGVLKVSINVANKTVHVHHEPNVVLTKDIKDKLDAHKFICHVTKDGANMNGVNALLTSNGTVQSSFHVPGICCSGEIQIIHDILDPIHGVIKVDVDVKNRTVHVHHVCKIVAAIDMKGVLEKKNFDCSITKDCGRVVIVPVHVAIADDNEDDNEDEDDNVNVNVTDSEVPSSPSTTPSSFKSSFFVSGICCAAEIPMINKILEPLKGVEKVSINVTNKTVYVHHVPNVISAKDIKGVLDAEKFDCRVSKDAGKTMTTRMNVNMNVNVAATSGKSAFFVSGICCAAEIPIIESILKPMNGVEKISINVTNKTVYIVHTFATIAAKDIKAALDAEKFDCRITKDAGAAAIASKVRANTYTNTTVMSKYVESTFLIPSLFESSDADKIREMLSRQYSKDQLSHSETHVPSKTIKIDHSPQLLSASSLMEFFKEEGMDVTLVADGYAEGIWSAGEEDDIEEHKVKLEAHIILSGVFWIVSMLHLIDTESKWDLLKYTALISVALGIPKIAHKAFLTMRRRQFDTNCMMLFAVVGAVALQEYSEAAAVAFLFSISDWLETLSTSRARNALSTIVRLRPERAKVKDPASGQFVYVPASDVPVGSIVSVRTGEYTEL